MLAQMQVRVRVRGEHGSMEHKPHKAICRVSYKP